MGILENISPIGALVKLATTALQARAASKSQGKEAGFAQLLKADLGRLNPQAPGNATENAGAALSQAQFTGDDKLFRSLDRDKNGTLSIQELNAGFATKQTIPNAKAMANYAMALYDANADGKLSQDEFGLSEDAFKAIDTDQSGQVSHAELMNAYTQGA